MVAWVFGEKYMSYIPFYIYSIYKAYPEYDVRIYVIEQVPNHIQKTLNYLRKNGCNNFEIILKNYIDELSLKCCKNKQIKAGFRWLYFDDAFYKYDAIYVGDIDIFICQEKIDIFEQHLKHCQAIGLPYSNVARKGISKSSFKRFMKALIIYGPKTACHNYWKNYRKGIYSFKRMTGLHFFLTDKAYCTNIKHAAMQVVDEINKIFHGEHPEKNIMDMVSADEWMLYRLIELSGYKIYESNDPKEMKYNSDFNKTIFRPHHGLHAGTLSTYDPEKVFPQNRSEILESEMYYDYYKYYKNLKQNDDVLKKLLSEDTFASNILKKFDIFYSNNITFKS